MYICFYIQGFTLKLNRKTDFLKELCIYLNVTINYLNKYFPSQ